jgi:hypothetical protein
VIYIGKDRERGGGIVRGGGNRYVLVIVEEMLGK